MPDKIVHNLDSEYAESFRFIVGGHSYDFKYPSAQEILDLQKKVKDDGDNIDINPFKEFISSVDDAPDFEEVWKTLRIPQIKAFKAMLESEFSA